MKTLSHQDLGKLVVKIQNGDDESFTRLYEATYKVQYYLALTNVKRPDLADDVVQDVYTILYRTIHSIQNPEQVVAYLNRINYTSSMNLLRKETRHIQEDFNEYAPFVTDDKPTPEDVSSKKSENDQLTMALSELEPRLSSVIVMKFVDGMQNKDIAQVMHISPKTVKRMLEKGLVQLKKILEKMKNSSLGISLLLVPFFRRLFSESMKKTVEPDRGVATFNSVTKVLGITGATTAVASTSLAAAGITTGVAAIGSLVAKVTIGATVALGLSIYSFVLAPVYNIEYLNAPSSGYTANCVTISFNQLNFNDIQEVRIYNANDELIGTSTPEEMNVITFTENGVYRLVVVGKNGNSRSQTFTVDTIDHTCPTFTENPFIKDNAIHVPVSDTYSGIDSSSLVVIDNNTGASIEAWMENSDICYPQEYTNTHITVQDQAGNSTSLDVSLE